MDQQCQEAFEKIRRYLEEPSTLIPTVPGRPLILYLTMLEESMGCVLGQHDDTGKKEQATYYLSKKFTDYEKRYSPLERTCCTLVRMEKQLRQYMLTHTTWLISKTDPIKYIFEKLTLTGRIARWKMSFCQNTTSYTSAKRPQREALWPNTSCITQAVLVSPVDRCFPFSARLGFDCTNNMVEYEACAMGIAMALDYQVKTLKVYGDSVLIIYQLHRE
ncbi:hypothetical protein CR513_01307, partial [Mucuna pruriens]